MTKGPDINLYYLALVLPPPYHEQVRHIQHYIADNFQSKASLKSPPHITVHMPFRLKPKQEDSLIKMLHDLTETIDSFKVELSDFKAFGKRVVYIAVKKSEALQRLYEITSKEMRLNFHLDNADYKNRGYHPHVTVAFRDLNAARFDKIWEYYSEIEFKAIFNASALSLLKHNGKSWDIHSTFQFRSKLSD